MTKRIRGTTFSKKVAACAMSVLVAGSMCFPSFAFAAVSIDDTELVQGANQVGGGTATLGDSTLDMQNVTANKFATDEDLTINFNGGNDIENTEISGSATVEMNFSGENKVEDIVATDESNLTISADGHNEFEEATAKDNASLTINVTGENDFEEIRGYDNADVSIRGTDCQKKDIINVGDDEEHSSIHTQNGNLNIDHVTVNLKGKEMLVGSDKGNVDIDTSKIAKDGDNEYTRIHAGGTMRISESVIDIKGTISSTDKMTINHSDVKAKEPDAKKHDDGPYRIWSKAGIDLIDEENGEVKQGKLFGENVFYVDTGDGKDVDLRADGDPAYYKCDDDDDDVYSRRKLAKTADPGSIWVALCGAGMSALAASHVLRRRSKAN
ncbi:MAG: hypothetical protein IKF78_08820 [Atopobiaceae bacterium]|nr:hypothetical protein [Atopobiaceae bacterium]